MKKIILSLLMLTMTGTGCSLVRPPTLDPNYAAYERIMTARFVAERKPLVEFDIDKEGRMSNFAMYPPAPDIKVEQKKPSAWFRLAEVAMRWCGYVGIVWQTGDAIEGVIEASKGNVTHINSANNNSRNEGTIDQQGDYATSRTETFDAEASYEPEE